MRTIEEGEAIRKALRDAPSGTVIRGATIVSNAIHAMPDAVIPDLGDGVVFLSPETILVKEGKVEWVVNQVRERVMPDYRG